MQLDFTGYDIPAHTQGALARYVECGFMPGGFLTAVLNNDLFGAVTRADELNVQVLPEIVRYVYNELPASCWGSTERMEAYAAKIQAAD